MNKKTTRGNESYELTNSILSHHESDVKEIRTMSKKYTDEEITKAGRIMKQDLAYFFAKTLIIVGTLLVSSYYIINTWDITFSLTSKHN